MKPSHDPVNVSTTLVPVRPMPMGTSHAPHTVRTSRRPIAPAFLLLSAGVAGGWWLAHRSIGWPSKAAGADAPSAVPLEREHQIEQATLRAKQAERVALAKATLLETLTQGQKALALADDFDVEVRTWSEQIDTLMTSERGRSLATQEAIIEGFRSIYDAPRPAVGEGASVRQRVEALLQPIKEAQASQNAAYTPNADWIASLQREIDGLNRLISGYREPRLRIEALLAQAQRSGEPGSTTLEQAIADLDARAAVEQARLVAEARTQARKEADAKLAAAEGDKVHQDTQQKLDQMAADKEAARVEAEAKAAKTRADAEHQRKLQSAQSADVKRLMVPFTTVGYWQPGADDGEIVNKGPVSLSRLRATGALEPTSQGLQQLLLLGGKSRSWQPPEKLRPRWGFEPYLDKLSASQLDELKKAQGYLRDLGDAMVELEMLAP